MNQFFFGVVASQKGSGGNVPPEPEPFSYIYPDSAPVLNSPVTFASNQVSVGGQLRGADVGANKEIILSGAWNNAIWIRNIAGTADDWVKITNLDNTFTAGIPSQTSGHGIDIEGTCNYIEIYGKDEDTPFRASAGGGLSAFVNRGSSDQYMRLYNVAAYDVSYTGALINSGTSSHNYRKAIFAFLKVDGLVSEGEGIYLGNTGSTFARTDWGLVTQCGVRNKGREGYQFRAVKYLRMFNSTALNVGATIVSPHNNLIQIFNSNGIIENCIFDNGKAAGNIFTHGVTIRNCYFGFETSGFYVGRTDNLSYYGEAEFNGQPVLFENCIIHWKGAGALSNVAWVEERVANWEFRNCIFVGNITTLYLDTRAAGFTNSLIGTLTTNGNTVLASLDSPTFVSTDYTNKDYLHTSSQYFIDRNMGRGCSPSTNLRILEIKEVKNQNVVQGTPFASAGLPATVKVLLQNGKYVDANVTWDSGDYNSSNLGLQTIDGTITPPANAINPDNLAITMNVNIVAA